MPIADAVSRLQDVVIRPDLPLTDATRELDRAGTGALVLSNGNRMLDGLLTDGDIRRGLLRGVPFSEPCGLLSTRHPVTGSVDQPASELARLLNDYDVNHLPLLDDEGRVAGLLLRRDLMSNDSDPQPTAVIMAGGFGTRLMPLTRNVPKPMLPIGGRPLIEITIERIRKAGIRHVSITTHHLSEKICEHFGDGHLFGVEMHYLSEETPLGTAGGLRLMKNMGGPLLVVNGDVLTTVDYQRLLEFHHEHRADITIGVRPHETQVPYGVVECDGPYLRRIEEKPKSSVLVNAGIYIVEPRALRFAPDCERFDMVELIQRLLGAGRRVATFPIVEYWIDVGRHADYEQAMEDAKHVSL